MSIIRRPTCLESTKMSEKIVILGGGPSGLGVAWGLTDRGFSNVCLLEKAPRLGGLSGSFEEDGMILDYGPHRFSPEYPDLVKKFRDLLGNDFLEVDNEHSVVFRDRIYHYPPRATDFLNLDSLKTSAKVLLSFAKARMKQQAVDDTFSARISHSFGPELYGQVVDPLCRKVWGDPESIDPDFAQLRFGVPTFVQWGKRWLGDNKASRDKVFHYPRRGFQDLWDRLGEHLQTKGVELRTEVSATRIVTENDRVAAVEIGDEQISVENLISTIPLECLLKLLGEEVPSLPSRGMILVGWRVRRSRVLPTRVMIFPENRYAFNRLSEQNQFSEETVPRGTSAILADILTEEGSAVWLERDEVLIDRVLADAEKLNLFRRSEIETAFVRRVPRAYPVPTRERERRQRDWNLRLSKIENLFCSGRFATSDYNNSHSALQKGLEMARYIQEHCSPLQWYDDGEAFRRLPIRD